MNVVRPRSTRLRPWAITVTPGWYVIEHGAEGEVRRWSVSPGMSVVRFSADPISPAILRASSERISRARLGPGVPLLLPLFIVFIAPSLPYDNRRAPHINDIFHRAREIGNKSGGSGYRLRGVRSYPGVERNGSEG